MEPHSNEPGQSPRHRCVHGQFLSSTFLSLRDRSGLAVFAFYLERAACASRQQQRVNPEKRISIRQGEIRHKEQRAPERTRWTSTSRQAARSACEIGRANCFSRRINFMIYLEHFFHIFWPGLVLRDWKSERATFMVNSSIRLPHAFIYI